MIRVVCVVIGDAATASAIAEDLERSVVANDGHAVRVLRAPDALLGSAFWRTRWQDARDWWERAVGVDAGDVLVLIDDAPGLAAEIEGTPGMWAVWCRDPAATAAYADAVNVEALVAEDAAAFAGLVVSRFAGGDRPRLFRPAWGPFQRDRARTNGEQPPTLPRMADESPETLPLGDDVTDARESVSAHALEGSEVLPGVDAVVDISQNGSEPWGPTLRDVLVDAETGDDRHLLPDSLLSSQPVDEARPALVHLPDADDIDPTDDARPWSAAEGDGPLLAVADVDSDATMLTSRGDGDGDAAAEEGKAAELIEPPLARLAALRPLPPEGRVVDDAPMTTVAGALAPAGRRRRIPVGRAVVRRLRPNWAHPAPAVTGATDDMRAGTVGQRLMRAHSTVLLSCSPKGGVAKTNDVIGVSELAAQAVEAFGTAAGLLDMNLVNPDIQEALNLDDDAATVRDLALALGSGVAPPPGASPTGSNLQVYVGGREPEGYSRGEIDRLAGYTSARWALTAVDLANCLPDLAGSDAAAVLAYWLRYAHVLMVPVDPTPVAFRRAADLLDAVREQVDAGGIDRMPGIVMPMLVRADGEALRDPQIGEMFQSFRERGVRLVVVPRSEDVELAAWPWRHTSIVTADEQVRGAYWEILDAALEVRPS